MAEKKSTGPPQKLVSRINHLRDLLRHLPVTIPLDPPNSMLQFSLDPEIVADGGYFPALSRALELGFGTWRMPGREIHFREHGKRLEQLISVIQEGVKGMGEGDRVAFEHSWLDRLIGAAVSHGAKIPAKPSVLTSKRKQSNPAPITNILKKQRSEPVINIDDTSSEAEAEPQIQSQFFTQAATDMTPVAVTAVIETSSNFDDVIIESQLPSNHLEQAAPTQKSFESFGWKKWVAGEKEKFWKTASEASRERRRGVKEMVEKREAAKVAHVRELARIRQQNHREQKKALREEEKVAEAMSINEVLLSAAEAQAASEKTGLDDAAAVSRAGKEKWRMNRNGTQGGAVQDRPTRINCAAATVKALKRESPTLYKQLHKATVHKWKQRGEKRWSDRRIKNIKDRHSLAGTGRTGILTNHPEIVEKIKATLISYRASAIPVNVSIRRATIIGIISKMAPELLQTFKCSENYIRSFFESVMNWTPRKATRTARHIPPDAADICERAFFRLVYAIEWFDIPSKLVVNVDQVGVYVLPNSSYTFHDKGAVQVDAAGKDEKRAYTLLVASTPSGDVLPFQQVWGDKSQQSTPSNSAPGMTDALKRGMHFTVAASEKNPRSHYSTLKTMKEWLEKIYIPYRNGVIEADRDLDTDQKSILFIDIYPVHASKDFRAHIFSEYPNIILIFVPEQISYGVSPEDIKFTTSFPRLRDASVQGLVDADEFMQSPQGRDLIQKSWCLSEACLTARESVKALNAYLEKDQILAEEIKARVGHVMDGCNLSLELEAQASTSIEQESSPDLLDDSDIPLQVIIREELGASVNVQSLAPFVVNRVMNTGQGEYIASAPEEDV
ncbi:hypothetical protein AN958_09263 [Leucoagaricus sp. SymC.cos]|nr:hypothetical protein AN958_09263 [Leucoagaricus sp. SymC.cos]